MGWSQSYANGFRKLYRLNLIIKGYIFYSLYAMPLGPLTEQLLESKIASITKYGTVDCSNSKGQLECSFWTSAYIWRVIVELVFSIRGTNNISELTCFGGRKIRFSRMWQFDTAGFAKTYFAVKVLSRSQGVWQSACHSPQLEVALRLSTCHIQYQSARLSVCC